MRKPKIYLDTSVISHLEQQDAPEKMSDTLAFWKDIEQGKYDVYLSDVTIDEFNRCRPEKLNNLLSYLENIKYTTIRRDNEIDALANHIISLGILTIKSLYDSRHIASALVAGCELIISWNFKHMVNPKIVKGIRAVSILDGYGDVIIVSPPSMLESED